MLRIRFICNILISIKEVLACIRYVDMTITEGFSLQRGMNFNINGKDYGIILMSIRSNAPYADRFEDDGTTLIYEGHDLQLNYVP